MVCVLWNVPFLLHASSPVWTESEGLRQRGLRSRVPSARGRRPSRPRSFAAAGGHTSASRPATSTSSAWLRSSSPAASPSPSWPLSTPADCTSPCKHTPRSHCLFPLVACMTDVRPWNGVNPGTTVSSWGHLSVKLSAWEATLHLCQIIIMNDKGM